MDKTFLEISDIIYEIKDKIKDGEYMSIMDKLSKIRTKYNENIVDVENICKCLEGEEENENKYLFCTTSIEKFITCKNLQYALTNFPILRNLIILHALPKILPNQDFELEASSFFKSDIQFEPINVDKKYNINEPETIKLTKTLILFINLVENIYCKFSRIFLIIAVYDLNFRYFGFLTKNFKYFETTYNKLSELINSTTNDVNNASKLNIIKKIYNLDENPYRIFQQILEPYYQKELEKQNIPALVIVFKKNPPTLFERRRNRELQRVQVEEEVIQESGYPLRNRIQNKLHRPRE